MMRFFLSGGLTLASFLALGLPQQVCAAESSDRASTRDSRMGFWRGQRVGLFIHWGPYSVLGGSYDGKDFGGNAEWLMKTAGISRDDYRQVAGKLGAGGDTSGQIVGFAKKCGFRYIIITAKHYDGFALFDSKVSDFDAVDVLPSGRDLLKEFVGACREAQMPLGFSYAVERDWYHPGGDTLGPAWDPSQKGNREDYLEKIALLQLRELAANYGPAFALLTDVGPGLSPRLARVFQEALPASAVVPRAFVGAGDYRYTDGNPLERTLTPIDWEKCNSLCDSWGFRRGRTVWKDSGFLLRELVQTVSRGGNYLLNVGLDGDGRMPQEATGRLQDLGRWLSSYGESIYDTSASPFLTHPWNGGATLRTKGDETYLYLHLFGSEKRQKVTLESLLTRPVAAELMGEGGQVPISGYPGGWELDLSGKSFDAGVSVVRVKLAGPVVMGEGPILAGGNGRFQLDLARGSYSEQSMKLERSAASSDLQLTGFSNPKDAGTWEVYTPSAVTVSLTLDARSQSAAPSLLVSVNDGPPIAVLSNSSGADAVMLQSSALRLPAGLSRIRLACPPPEPGTDLSAITTSRIELIPAN